MRKREKENHEIVFGPNGQGHVYKPAPYHGCKAKNRKIRLDGLMMLILSSLYSIWQMFILVCHIQRT